ncbi:MAG: exodeoxyribonuclease VII large subunit [Candidatus Saccharimonadales bacterium]
MSTPPTLSVSDFVALTNQTLEYAYPTIAIEGEVAGFTVNQGKYVFFAIKDSEASIDCFMMAYALHSPIEDGMKVVMTAAPKLTQRGKFSLTVRYIRPSGEGSIKKSFELLKVKLDKEGLFAPERKRPLPQMPQRIAVISSTQAAGYADFIKILDDRWGGIAVDVGHVQVQGDVAAEQMIRAMTYFNSQNALPDVLVLIRGGGSLDDLSVFNDEALVRTIAASRIPTVVGVGHETDNSLADMVADVRAATPSNAAQLIVPDRHDTIRHVRQQVQVLLPTIENSLVQHHHMLGHQLRSIALRIDERWHEHEQQLVAIRRLLAELDPHRVLARGYAIVRGQQAVGSTLTIETQQTIIQAEVTDVRHK